MAKGKLKMNVLITNLEWGGIQEAYERLIMSHVDGRRRRTMMDKNLVKDSSGELGYIFAQPLQQQVRG